MADFSQDSPTDGTRSSLEFFESAASSQVDGVATQSPTPFSISFEGLAIALTRPLPVAILCTAAIAKVCLIFSVLPRMAKNYDFQCYYVSGLALRRHLNPYTLDYRPLISALRLPLTPDYKADFTPTLLLCFKLLTRWSILEAFWIWIALNAVALAVALYCLLADGFSTLKSSSVWMLVPFAILYAPVGIHFQYAQTVIPILALLALAMRAMQHRHDATAGILLAVAGLLRAFPVLLLIYLVIAKRWRVLRWSILALLIGGLLTIALVGRSSLIFSRRSVGRRAR